MRLTVQFVLCLVGRPVFPPLSFGMASHDWWVMRSLLCDKPSFIVLKLESLSEHGIAEQRGEWSLQVIKYSSNAQWLASWAILRACIAGNGKGSD